MEMGPEVAKQAWARLAGLPDLDGLQVVVDAESPLGPAGWIGILVMDDTLTVSVPRADLAQPVAAALANLTSEEAILPDVVVSVLPPTKTTLGPAALFYPPKGFSLAKVDGEELPNKLELTALFDEVTPDDLDESGMLEITSPAFVSRSTSGRLAAACGYRHWPNHVAHLSVLAHPDHRRRNHGSRVAAAAIQHAIQEDLLPQWRARPVASQKLALSLGLVQVGTQFSLELA
jgi:GNAT superfamily N-acetyltransferase